MISILYRVRYYVSPPIDQYLKFKNHCSLMCNPDLERHERNLHTVEGERALWCGAGRTVDDPQPAAAAATVAAAAAGWTGHRPIGGPAAALVAAGAVRRPAARALPQQAHSKSLKMKRTIYI